MEIVLTDFAKERHFNPEQSGTVITDVTPEEFMKIIKTLDVDFRVHPVSRIQDGYAPFCKLLFLQNWTNAKAGTLRITPDNDIWLESAYKARVDTELPVLVRWLELPAEKIPQAEFLCLVLYNKQQLAKEGTDIGEADYGIVAILGQMHNQEEPLNPITMMRNALGVEYGGSGVSIDREAYLRSVDFWNKNAAVKIKR